MGLVLLELLFYVYVLQVLVFPCVLFLLVIVLSVLLRCMDSDYPFGIFKLSSHDLLTGDLQMNAKIKGRSSGKRYFRSILFLDIILFANSVVYLHRVNDEALLVNIINKEYIDSIAA